MALFDGAGLLVMVAAGCLWLTRAVSSVPDHTSPSPGGATTVVPSQDVPKREAQTSSSVALVQHEPQNVTPPADGR